ncbi:MAG: hypothetical protein ACHQIM_13295 [Sphingobacteriales bacterium]
MATKTSFYPTNIQQQSDRSKPFTGHVNASITYTEKSSMEWYRLTESSREILASVMAAAARAILNEEDQELPDQRKIGQLEKISEEVHQISNHSSNFQSQTRMKAIIRKYTPILHSLELNG